ncbi:MAG: alpha/beta fold hydrolase [Betaproteobacteria bacterium]|nr:alpha/beta fold hydrolase [Betaproteobacteria bacterium]
MSTAISEQWINVESGKLRVRRQGSGKPLLFLHGAQGMNVWPAFLDRLAEYAEVIAPDLPGFGRSDASQSVTSVPDLARITLDLLDMLKLDQVHVAGHCIGGWLAMELAIRSPKLASLTLINSAGIHVDGAKKGDFFIASPEEFPELMFDDASLGRAYFAAEGEGEFETAVFQNRLMAAKLAWSPRLFDPNLVKWLRRIRVPVQILWGGNNRVLPAAYGAGLAQALKAPISVIPDTGHYVHVERPAECAEKLRSFIIQ